MNSKRFFNKSIATALSLATLLTTTSPCTSAVNDSQKEITESNNSSSHDTLDTAANFLAISGGVMLTVSAATGLILVTSNINKCTKKITNYIRHGGDDNYNNVLSVLNHMVFETANFRLQSGETLLRTAVINNAPRICGLLLERGANVDAANNYGYTALHEAAKLFNLNICDLLLDNGANPNATANNGNTPLHEISNTVFDSVLDVDNIKRRINLLVLRHANINAQNNDGNTPLHLAALTGNAPACRQLRLRGADVSIRNNANHTPLDIALNDEVRQILQ